MKLIFKNGNSIALITILSLFSSPPHPIFKPSRWGPTTFYPSKLVTFVALSLFLFISYILTLYASALATSLATATSYENDNRLSLHDLSSLFKSKWRRSFERRRRQSRNNPMQLLWCLWMVEIAVAVPVAMLDPNPVTSAIAGVFVASFFVFVGGAAAVVAAAEDGCEAVEKAAEGGGSWFSGLALNLVFNAAMVMISLSLWWNVSLNVMVYGFFFANCVSMANVLWNVVYTVYYLRCVEYHHGETVQQFGDFLYTAFAGWDRMSQFEYPNRVPNYNLL